MFCIFFPVAFPKNVDGTHKIIIKDEKCTTATNKCFWKQPIDVENRVKIRNDTWLKPTVKLFTSIKLSGFLIVEKLTVNHGQYNFFVPSYVF